MQKTALLLANSDEAISTDQLDRFGRGWLLDGEFRQLSKNTLGNRRFLLEKFLWYLREHECSQCGKLEVKQFLAYISNDHSSSGGRWGNPHSCRSVRPQTVLTYFTKLRTLFRFLVAEGAMMYSPLESIRPPIARTVRNSLALKQYAPRFDDPTHIAPRYQQTTLHQGIDKSAKKVYSTYGASC